MSDKEVLELTKLDASGMNFPLWKFSISFALQGRELMEFVKGIAVAPADDNEGKLQKHNNKKALAYAFFLASIDRKLHPLLINCTNVKEMWDNL